MATRSGRSRDEGQADAIAELDADELRHAPHGKMGLDRGRSIAQPHTTEDAVRQLGRQLDCAETQLLQGIPLRRG